MVTQECTVRDPLGLHARLTTSIVRVASGSRSSVTLAFGGVTADARDALALMRLDVRGGEQILIRADGPDEQAVLGNIAALLER